MLVAADESLGAVQRIDQEEAGSDLIGGPELAGVLLGNHRNVRKAPGELGEDQRFAPTVGLGDRTGVGLAVDLQARAPQGQDRPAGGLDDIGQHSAEVSVRAHAQ